MRTIPTASTRRVANFVTLQFILGKMDVSVFDGIINGLISVADSELQVELLGLKDDAKKNYQVRR